jgi:hypothetical protein
VDLLSEIKGVGGFERVARNAETIALFGRQVKVISIDDLIDSKNAMGREKDLMAVRELETIRTSLKRK